MEIRVEHAFHLQKIKWIDRKHWLFSKQSSTKGGCSKSLCMKTQRKSFLRFSVRSRSWFWTDLFSIFGFGPHRCSFGRKSSLAPDSRADQKAKSVKAHNLNFDLFGPDKLSYICITYFFWQIKDVISYDFFDEWFSMKLSFVKCLGYNYHGTAFSV